MGTHRHGRHNRSQHLSAVPRNASAETHFDAEEYDELKDLQAFVGGTEALMRLDAEPLPDERFDWSAIELQDEEFVSLVLMLVDECCEQLLDNEYRTIARRILARVATRDPRVLRRSANRHRFAAGLIWLAGRGSGAFPRRGRRPKSASVWGWFAVTDCTDRGRSIRSAGGLFPDADLADYTFIQDDALALGDAELIHSRYRQQLITQRDLRMRYSDERRQQRPPVVSLDGGNMVLSMEPITVLGAGKSLALDGERVGICIMLGDELNDATCYALSVPDAHKLVQCVQRALNDPPPQRSP